MIRSVPADIVRPLRLLVLRPGQPPASAVWPGDDDAIHLAAYQDGDVVGVATLTPEDDPGPPPLPALRLRGMATHPNVRGAGVGKDLVEACGLEARRRGVLRLWCYARTSARGFYARLGWRERGDVFDIAGVGPHVVMFHDLG